jgi:hypothetical protein
MATFPYCPIYTPFFEPQLHATYDTLLIKPCWFPIYDRDHRPKPYFIHS